MQESKYRLVSIGYATQNKALDSRTLECMPIEMLPYIDGDVTPDTIDLTHEGIDSKGNQYTTKANIGNTIECEWLQWGSNRVTPPDVRRGELVFIWQFADDDTYNWTSPGKDDHLRRLETVIWAFSATRDETVKKLTPLNSYVLEVSTHKKLITLTTSKANGEQYGYTVQVNTDRGGVVIMDDDGQYLELNSVERRWIITNKDGSIYKMDKTNITEFAKDTISRKTKAYSVECDTFDLKASKSIATKTVQHTAKATGAYSMTAPKSTFNGLMTVTGLATLMGGITASAGGGAANIQIPLNVTSPVTVTGLLTNNGINVGSTHQHNETGLGGGITTPPL